MKSALTVAWAGFVTVAQLGFAGIAAAEEASAAPTSAYYEAPVISLLSNHGKGWDLSDEILGEGASVDFGGWVQFGYTTDSTGLFNRHPHEFRNHQTWLYVEKKADGSDGFDWGGRVDAMYGADGPDTQAFGNHAGKYDYSNAFNHGTDGFAIPQIYAEFAYKDVSLKAGHFYTLLGYEVVPAPSNFFFSHAFTMYLSEAFTHTGALATYTGLENFTFYAGWTAGWDTGFDQVDGGSNFLGGASYTPIEQVTGTYILTAGKLGWIGSGYTHSIVVDTTPFEHFKYVIQSDLVSVSKHGANYSTIGINQYLIYHFIDEIGVGARIEWWKNGGTSYYEVTGGLNLKPLPNLMVRPEGRYQWSPGADNGGINPAGLPVDDNGIFGIDVILTF